MFPLQQEVSQSLVSVSHFCGLRRSGRLSDLIREAIISVAKCHDEPGFWLYAVKVCVVSLTALRSEEYGLRSMCELRRSVCVCVWKYKHVYEPLSVSALFYLIRLWTGKQNETRIRERLFIAAIT